jgi:hypothetical protein
VEEHRKFVKPLTQVLASLSNTFGILAILEEDSFYFEKQREFFYEIGYFYKNILELN